MQLAKDERNLGGVVPVPWFQSILNPSNSGDLVNRKWLAFVEVTEQCQDFQNLFLAADTFMMSDNLGEEHLANSNHASPSSVRNIRANHLIGELGKP